MTPAFIATRSPRQPMSVSTLSDSDDDLHSIPANATQLDSSDTNSTSPSSSRDYFVSLDSTDDTRPPATTSPGDLSRASSVAASIIPASTGPPTTFEALLPSIAPRIAPQGDDDDTASSKSGGRTSLWQSVRFGGRRNSDNDDESSRTRSSILAKGHHAWGRLTGAFRGTKGNDGSTPATFRTNPPESTVATGEYSVPGAYGATDDVTSDLSNPVIRSLKWGADYLAGAGSAIYSRYTKDRRPRLYPSHRQLKNLLHASGHYRGGGRAGCRLLSTSDSVMIPRRIILQWLRRNRHRQPRTSWVETRWQTCLKGLRRSSHLCGTGTAVPHRQPRNP